MRLKGINKGSLLNIYQKIQNYLKNIIMLREKDWKKTCQKKWLLGTVHDSYLYLLYFPNFLASIYGYYYYSGKEDKPHVKCLLSIYFVSGTMAGTRAIKTNKRATVLI